MRNESNLYQRRARNEVDVSAEEVKVRERWELPVLAALFRRRRRRRDGYGLLLLLEAEHR